MEEEFQHSEYAFIYEINSGKFKEGKTLRVIGS